MQKGTQSGGLIRKDLGLYDAISDTTRSTGCLYTGRCENVKDKGIPIILGFSESSNHFTILPISYFGHVTSL